MSLDATLDDNVLCVAYADGHDCAATSPAQLVGDHGHVVLGWMPEHREWLAEPIRGWTVMGGYALGAPVADGRLRYLPTRLSAVPHVLAPRAPRSPQPIPQGAWRFLACRRFDIRISASDSPQTPLRPSPHHLARGSRVPGRATPQQQQPGSPIPGTTPGSPPEAAAHVDSSLVYTPDSPGRIMTSPATKRIRPPRTKSP